MELPICSFCAKTGMLCTGCQRKLADGKITQLDIELSKILSKIANKYPSLQNVKITRAVAVDSFVLLEVRKQDISNIIGSNRRILNEIEQKLGQKIHVIEFAKSERKIIESLFSPVEVLGVNKIFVPDGSEEFKVRIRRIDVRDLPMSEEMLQEATYALLQRHIRIFLEE
ncbi:MAG: hypothetical protein ACE5R6_06900 [Candidatus Heimdallarchaeota archaeon]